MLKLNILRILTQTNLEDFLEHDGIFENDENAASPLNYTTLPLPAGFSKENVQNAFSKLDCPAITTGDDFHFGVDVIWSVEYVP